MTDDPEALLWQVARLRLENAQLRHENTELQVRRCIRVLDERDFNVHVTGFMKCLRECWDVYSAKSAEISHQREALVMAIAVINKFIRGFDSNSPTGMLSDVSCALVNAKNGINTPLFDPEPRDGSGRPPLAMGEQMSRAGAALAVTFLMNSGISLARALQEVSKMTGWRRDDLRSFRGKVASDNFASGKDSERWAPAIKMYREMLAETQQQAEQARAAHGSAAEREAWRDAATGILLSLRNNGWTGKSSP